jgi:Skp family chaperone for outer membrane proteins
MELSKQSNEERTPDVENSRQGQSRFDELHNRVQSKLDELHADLKQLAADVHEANLESKQARKDRIEGFKRALSDLSQAAEHADREWS